MKLIFQMKYNRWSPGAMPALEKDYWSLPSGPAWTWWVLAILPLDSQAQVTLDTRH